MPVERLNLSNLIKDLHTLHGDLETTRNLVQTAKEASVTQMRGLLVFHGGIDDWSSELDEVSCKENYYHQLMTRVKLWRKAKRETLIKTLYKLGMLAPYNKDTK